MKHFRVFILIFASSCFSAIYACGYYPYGEDIRFCFLNPESFGYNSFKIFNYTSKLYADDSPERFSPMLNLPNTLLWKKYCRDQVGEEAISEAVYALPAAQINIHSKNKMVRYLFKTKDFDAIRYLVFAKKGEPYISYSYEDAWEKERKEMVAEMKAYLEEAQQFAAEAKSDELRCRYLFLAMRMAHYCGEKATIKKVYADYFASKNQKSIIDYEALFFYCLTEIGSPKRNCLLAQVFENAPDKRYAVLDYYDFGIQRAATLKYAQNGKERSNIWLVESIRRSSRALPDLRQMYINDPGSESLSFMLLREVNKIEDWILTPTYSLFLPVLRADYWENSNSGRILQRVETDREYARKLLEFVESADMDTVENRNLWNVSRAYLQFFVKDFDGAMQSVTIAETDLRRDDVYYKQFQLIKGLIATANQPQGKAVVPDVIKPILLGQFNAKNYKYIFAVGRQLENLGNSTDAALLFSRSKSNGDDNYDKYGNFFGVYWKTRNNSHTLQDDYYDNYISYIDAFYTSTQTQQLINNINGNKSHDPFSSWLYRNTWKDMNLLYDILGSIYIRQNDIAEAREAFSHVDKSFQKGLFLTNPFLQIKQTPEFITYNHKENLSKAQITERLLVYIIKAENPQEKNRDFYYFLVANCYYNMSYSGSAWEMRRNYRSVYRYESNFPDDTDYYECTSARKYYAKAFAFSKTEKFKALCLRFIGECDRNKADNKLLKWYERYDHDGISVQPDAYYKDLKLKYPEYYKDLTSDCTLFQDYFLSRR